MRNVLTGWRHPERLIFVLVLGALVAVWIATVTFTLAERRLTLERAESQLDTIAITLADFNELVEQATGELVLSSSENRTAAIWRALLQYPTASIWVETDGTVSGGQAPAGDVGSAIVVREDRGHFSVSAALPEADALTEWRRTAWQRVGILTVASIAFLLLTRLLVRALRQRAAAEQQAGAAQERGAQLAVYKTELENTVTLRTKELKESYERLEKELIERKTAEAQLQEHDALLHAVAKSAGELLGAQSHDDAIAGVLELIGQTVGVSRVHINAITTDRDGHLRSSIRYGWCAPGMLPTLDNPALQELDLTTGFPGTGAPLLAGAIGTYFVEDIGGQYKALFEHADMRSFLQIPVLVEGKLWGSFDFIDSSDTKRQWSWAETDTLHTLAGLIGVAITRARYVKELADANMIVQNSPTILYRVRGEPPFPLIYVSHNITKFGYDVDKLVGTSNWAQLLMEPEDESKLMVAMSRTLEKDAKGASIEFRLRTGDGSYRWVENRYTTVRDKQGRLVEIEGMIIDITERKAAEEKIALLARTDGLTGLANRATFIERIRQAFAATRRGATPFA
ncbi:MAG TPA: PAS domain-containing protein, partial [Gammaproteobacteria bacterium]|nr:PAS domain-containing protein [Gammaproteobacteria bacterium]